MFFSSPVAGLALAAGMVNAIALPQQPKHYFSFGASYTQTLFNETKAQPSVQNVFGNPDPITAADTFTGGSNYVMFLTEKDNSSPVYNYNFARSGATTNSSDNVISLIGQVGNHFLPAYNVIKNRVWTSSNSYFSFHFGINDIGAAVDNPLAEPHLFSAAVQLLYFGVLGQLYEAGARRFMIINVPPMDRTPKLAGNPAEQAKWATWVGVYNQYLLSNAQNFQRTHSGSHVTHYDMHAFMAKVLDEPQTYGFANSTCYAADGASCVFWDNWHPGSKFDDLWSAEMVVAMNALGYNGSKPVDFQEF